MFSTYAQTQNTDPLTPMCSLLGPTFERLQSRLTKPHRSVSLWDVSARFVFCIYLVYLDLGVISLALDIVNVLSWNHAQ